MNGASADAGPVLLIHGGAGAREGDHARFADYRRRLGAILEAVYPALAAGGSARAAVIEAVRRLEDDPLFNAGTGSRLQRDGVARMSAAIADGRRRRFAGVLNIEAVRNPVLVADSLDGETHRLRAGPLATAYARERGFADYDPVTDHRRREHRQRLADARGTVGAVALDAGGALCAATSTGGVGFEAPGRVSDSATVAGTYASARAAVSCTGVGEQIVDQAVAARVVTRVDDGTGLAAALDRTLREAPEDHSYGLIAAAADGSWGVRQTAGVTTLFAAHDGRPRLFRPPGRQR